MITGIVICILSPQGGVSNDSRGVFFDPWLRLLGGVKTFWGFFAPRGAERQRSDKGVVPCIGFCRARAQRTPKGGMGLGSATASQRLGYGFSTARLRLANADTARVHGIG